MSRKQKIRHQYEGPFLAEDCLLVMCTEGPFTRKPPLKPAESAAIYDPKEALALASIIQNRGR
jgi:hypothetical protein